MEKTPGHILKDEETPLDIAIEIQEALEPLTYRLTAFADEGGEYAVKLKKEGVYHDSSRG